MIMELKRKNLKAYIIHNTKTEKDYPLHYEKEIRNTTWAPSRPKAALDAELDTKSSLTPIATDMNVKVNNFSQTKVFR